MTTRKTPAKRPTPIRTPEPIIFPVPVVPTLELPQPKQETQRLVPFPKPPISAELRTFIAHCIARTIYRVADWELAQIVTMSEAEFEAFCLSITEDDE